MASFTIFYQIKKKKANGAPKTGIPDLGLIEMPLVVVFIQYLQYYLEIYNETYSNSM